MLYFAQAILSTLRSLERQCPSCNHKQVVPKSKAAESVLCEKCGTGIPPKPKQS
ncbi:hypothetical protein [Candidatus Korobacter versatilis]|uniref:hypothetical protein n=1 Tax=Candidatus Korobacter versatilis TaxID=658062 RepID=UPI0002EDFE1C